MYGGEKKSVGSCKIAGYVMQGQLSLHLYTPKCSTDNYRLNGYDTRPHSLQHYREKFGTDYLKQIPNRYWTHFSGRAVQTFKEILPMKPLREVLAAPACRELIDTTHFHIDLYHRSVPGLCSGFGLLMHDLGKELNEDEYPILTILYNGGIRSLLEYAKKEFGIVPAWPISVI